jgi:hypothetical protein
LAPQSPGVRALVCPDRSHRQLERGAHHHEADETSPYSTWRFHHSQNPLNFERTKAIEAPWGHQIQIQELTASDSRKIDLFLEATPALSLLSQHSPRVNLCTGLVGLPKTALTHYMGSLALG